jgi:hypothetical protein
VPLTAVAAELLQKRKKQHGNGPLFPNFHGSDDVCKQFDAACVAAGVKDLLTKDLRRGFLNRNKDEVSELDLRQIVGDSPDLERQEPTEATKAVKSALGHKRLTTTGSYAVLHLEQLARRFTATSRNAAVLELVRSLRVTAKASPATARRRRCQQAPGSEQPWRAPTPEVAALARALGVSLDLKAF